MWVEPFLGKLAMDRRFRLLNNGRHAGSTQKKRKLDTVKRRGQTQVQILGSFFLNNVVMANNTREGVRKIHNFGSSF